jgi:peroxiredoxin
MRISRRQTLRALGLALPIGLAGGLWPRAATAGQKVGQAAADFSLPVLSGGMAGAAAGGAARLADFRGKVVVVDFFASWCEPCKKELPELEKLHKEVGAQGVVVLGVNIDRERNNAAAMVKQLQVSFRVLLDTEGKVAELYDPPKMPSTYVIDKAGVLRFVNPGYDGPADIARLRKQLSELNR